MKVRSLVSYLVMKFIYLFLFLFFSPGLLIAHQLPFAQNYVVFIKKDYISFYSSSEIHDPYATEMISNCALINNEDEKNQELCSKLYNENIKRLLNIVNNSVEINPQKTFSKFSARPEKNNNIVYVSSGTRIEIDSDIEHNLELIPVAFFNDEGKEGEETFSTLKIVLDSYYRIINYSGGTVGSRGNDTTIDQNYVPLDANIPFEISFTRKTGSDKFIEKLSFTGKSLSGALDRRELVSLLYVKDSGFFSIPIILLFSTLLGMFHALSPGHGKAICATYLIATKGRIKDVAILAGAVTLTHIISVVVLGISYFFISKFFIPKNIMPYLQLFSGLLVFAMGIYMVVKFRSQHKAKHPNDHSHHHHEFSYGSKIYLRNLLAGMSAGMVPCASAFAILLISISLNRVLHGLAIITFFSLGLSMSLMLIGILVTKASSVADRFSKKNGLILKLPFISAFLITFIGIALMVRSFYMIMQ